MKRLLAVALLALATPLAAMEFFPPAPDSHTFVGLLTATPFCQVERTDVTIQGSTITVTPVSGGGTCPADFFPLRADLGVIPPGIYTVVTPFEQARLVVREADPNLIVSPVGGPNDGKRTVQVFGAKPGDVVLFDGVPAPPTAQQVSTDFLVVTPPAHAPGTVDVTVGARKLVAEYTFYERGAEPDPFVFEPVLFPVAYDGVGEFGSDWRTDNRMGTGLTLVRFQKTIATKACSGDCNGFDWSGILAGQSQSGLLFWVARRRMPAGVTDEFRTASRITDVSRLHGNGTSLPVARENDFRRRMTFDGVPLGGNARATVRLYALKATVATLRITSPSGGVVNRGVELTPINGVFFASLDLAPLPRPDLATITVSGTDKLWALITITDNDTQEVTALWPQ